MSLDAQDRRTLNSLPQLPSLYATYGVEVNALTVEEIFALYERIGFLYPEKASRLRPHLELAGCWVAGSLCSTSLPLVTKNEAWPRWPSGERRPTAGCHNISLAITILLHPAR